MPIEEGDIVQVTYVGTFDSGEEFDSTEKNDGKPLKFTVGAHQVIPGFENAVIGKEKDEDIEIRLEPKDAYGDYNPEAIGSIPLEQLPEDLDPEVGMMLAVAQKHGDHVHQVPAVVKKVKDEEIVLDLNHPMAGKTLNFKMKVVDIEKSE